MNSKQPYSFAGSAAVQKGIHKLGKLGENKFTTEAKKSAKVKKTNEGILLKAATNVLAAEDAKKAKRNKRAAETRKQNNAAANAPKTKPKPTLARRSQIGKSMRKKGY